MTGTDQSILMMITFAVMAIIAVIILYFMPQDKPKKKHTH